MSPDGLNINRECGALAPEQMRREVLARRADIGIALDGDADRLIVADERGEILDGDQLMALIATSLARGERLAGGALVATVMSNLGLERCLTGQGIGLHRTAVGDRYVVEKMRSLGCNLGGEQSGPHHPQRLCDDRRRADRGAAGAGRDRRDRQAGQRGVPRLRAGAAAVAQRTLRRRAGRSSRGR